MADTKPPPAPPSATRELDLISTVELRIALASTPSQLQTLITKYLAPLLLKLGSPHAEVRAKTRQVCQHISARLRDSREIVLPVAKLVEQFRGAGRLITGDEGEDYGEELRMRREGIRRFALVFIGMGLGRVDGKADRGREGREILSALLRFPVGEDGEEITVKVREDAMTASTRLWIQGFYFLLKLLPTWEFPERGSKEDLDMKAELGLSESETRFLAEWLTKFLLCDSQAFVVPDRVTQDANFQPLPELPGLTRTERAVFANWAASQKETSATSNKSSAMTTATFETSVSQKKVAAAKFLFTAVFTDEERFIPAVIMGADDTNAGLFRVSDIMFKQCNFDLESEILVDGLIELYFGRRELSEEETEKNGDEMEDEAFELRQRDKIEARLTLPAKPKLQIRILNLLAKSKRATTRTNATLKLLEQQLTDITDLGLEVTKLRNALFNLLTWNSRVASEGDILTIAPKTMEGFRNHVVYQGWPSPTETTGRPLSRSEIDMRGKAYENIGIWAAKMDFTNDKFDTSSDNSAKMDLLRFLLTSLRCDSSSPDIQVSIESALGHLLNKFSTSMDESVTIELKELLMEQSNTEVGKVDDRDGYKTVRSTRFAAVRFANRCLPFADCQARWMDLLAIGAGGMGERQELVEEGTKGLDPYWWSMQNGSKTTTGDLEFPSSADTIQYFFIGVNGEKMVQEPQGSFRRALPSAVGFCWSIFIHEALEGTDMAPRIESDWERKIDALVATNEKARSSVRIHLRKARPDLLTTLVNAAVTGMCLRLNRCAEYAVRMCSLVPDPVIGGVLQRAMMIEQTSVSNDLVTQQQAARLLGIFASHPDYPEADRDNLIRGALSTIQGWRDAIGQDLNRARGLLLCVGFIISRQALRGSLPVGDYHGPGLVSLIRDILLESRDNALRNAGHISLGQLMLCLQHTHRKNLDLPSEKITEQLALDAKKEQESAVVALGRFIRGFSRDDSTADLTEKALERLYALQEIRRPEIQFAVGEALSVAVAGWKSKATIAEFDLDIPTPTQGVDQAMLEAILDKVIEDSKTTKPSLKKASAIWLLCLIQYVGDEPCVQSRLRQCQAAFARLLSDRDEIVQETGSRGLSLVYEIGDKNLKDDLVRDLVASFTGSNAKLGGTVTSETELFDANALPTGDGSLTTYKDIVSLASEMGDPSLVYRFMNLASNNAIWTSRSAFGRFGLGNVLADSAYLAENKSFYPKLYRYRFDPNPNVQKSMNDIWNALVKDSNAVVEQHFELIIQDLLKSLVSGKEWRVRQASCAAIAEIIQGRDVEKYDKYLDEIWTKAFKVLDDIKETVRVAAMSLCRTLTNLLIRNLEVGDGITNRAQKLLDHAMPFLLQQLHSGAAKEVQEYAMGTLLKVIKKSPPKALRPYAAIVLETLIMSLDSLEPEGVNYLHLNAEKYGLTAEKLDSARVSYVSSSPAMQAIERCLEGLDDDTMQEAMKRLEGSFKSIIGLPSKVGLSSVLVTLTVRHHLKFRPYADRFTQQLRKHVFDRNETVTNSYCLALAYLMRIVSDTEVEETSRFAKNQYFVSEEPGRRHVAGEIVLAISKVSNDRFMALASAFLPFAFIGRNDIDEQVREPFKKTWDDNVGGSRAVSLYFMDILELCQFIDSPQWGIKHTIARAIADLIACLDSAVDGNYTLKQAEAIWPLLEKVLGGKTWDGKEVVVDSFPKFVRKAQTLWDSKREQFDKIALREAKRTNPVYRPHGIAALGEIAKIRRDPDFAQKVLTTMSDVVGELGEAPVDRMIIDREGASLNSEGKQDASRDNTLSAIIASCFKAVTFADDAPEATLKNLQLLMTILRRALADSSSLSYMAMYEGIKIFFNHLMDSQASIEWREKMATSEGWREFVKGIVGLLLSISAEDDERFLPIPEKSNTERIRMERARALQAYVASGMGDAEDKQKTSAAVKLWLNNERSGPVRDVLFKLQHML